MSDLTISINGGNPEQLTDFVQSAVIAITEITDELDVNVEGLEWSHPEWERGDPCPSCGSTEFIGYALTPQTYTIPDNHEVDEGGLMHEGGVDQDPDEPVSVACANSSCHAQLYRAPPAFLS